MYLEECVESKSRAEKSANHTLSEDDYYMPGGSL